MILPYSCARDWAIGALCPSAAVSGDTVTWFDLIKSHKNRISRLWQLYICNYSTLYVYRIQPYVYRIHKQLKSINLRTVRETRGPSPHTHPHPPRCAALQPAATWTLRLKSSTVPRLASTFRASLPRRWQPTASAGIGNDTLQARGVGRAAPTGRPGAHHPAPHQHLRWLPGLETADFGG